MVKEIIEPLRIFYLSKIKKILKLINYLDKHVLKLPQGTMYDIIEYILLGKDVG